MPSLEAQAGADQARLWAHLLRALLKVGNDLFLEVDDRQLVLRTLNSARSAFVTAKFSPSFFETYEATAEPARCKVLLKPCVAVFKNVIGVQSFTIRFDSDAAVLSMDFECREGITKRFQLVYEACDVLQAVYSKERCGSRATLPARPLHECLSNFHTTVDEVTLSASPVALQLGTYVDPAAGGGGSSGVLHTEMSFNAREFELFEVAGPGAVTFSIRELKPVAALLEVLGLAVSIHLDGPGSPIIFGATSEAGTFAIDLVLSTLQQDEHDDTVDTTAEAANAARSVGTGSQRSHASGGVGDHSGGGGRRDGAGSVAPRRGGRESGVGHSGSGRAAAYRAGADPTATAAVAAGSRTSSFGGGSGAVGHDPIVSANTTPPTGSFRAGNVGYARSECSSVPATDRLHPAYGGGGDDSDFAAAPRHRPAFMVPTHSHSGVGRGASAKHSGRASGGMARGAVGAGGYGGGVSAETEESREEDGEVYGGSQGSTTLSIPATDRRDSEPPEDRLAVGIANRPEANSAIMGEGDFLDARALSIVSDRGRAFDGASDDACPASWADGDGADNAERVLGSKRHRQPNSVGGAAEADILDTVPRRRLAPSVDSSPHPSPAPRVGVKRPSSPYGNVHDTDGGGEGCGDTYLSPCARAPLSGSENGRASSGHVAGVVSGLETRGSCVRAVGGTAQAAKPMSEDDEDDEYVEATPSPPRQ